MTWHKNLLLMTVCGLFAGCSTSGTRNYEQPTDWQSKQCLEYCVSERLACRTVAQNNLRACKNAYQEELRRYEYCRVHRVYGCRRPIESCSAPQLQQCTDGYDLCFIGCGGKIHTPGKEDDDLFD